MNRNTSMSKLSMINELSLNRSVIYHPIPLNPLKMSDFIIKNSNNIIDENLLFERYKFAKSIPLPIYKPILCANNDYTNISLIQLNNLISQSQECIKKDEVELNNLFLQTNNLLFKNNNQHKRSLKLKTDSYLNQPKKSRLLLETNVSLNKNSTFRSNLSNWVKNNNSDEEENVDVETVDKEDIKVQENSNNDILIHHDSQNFFNTPSCSENTSNKSQENSTFKRESLSFESDVSLLKLHRKAHIEFYR